MNGMFGTGNDGTVNMQKDPLDTVFDLDKVGSQYLTVTGTKRLYVTWRAESGGLLRGGTIDLNAFAAAFNADHQVVAACHDDDKVAVGGAMRYGGNTKAKKGKSAKEYTRINFDALRQRPDITDLVFGATSLNNPLSLAKVAELQVWVTEDTDVDFDVEDQSTISGVVIPGELRPIEGPATATLFYRFHLPTTVEAPLLRRVTDRTTVQPTRDVKQTWRNLLGDLRGAVQRPMFEPAA